jgi:hypothetical protein
MTESAGEVWIRRDVEETRRWPGNPAGERSVAAGRERRREGDERGGAQERQRVGEGGALGARREGVAAPETGRHRRKEYAPFY